jgi:hypothetical protein
MAGRFTSLLYLTCIVLTVTLAACGAPTEIHPTPTFVQPAASTHDPTSSPAPEKPATPTRGIARTPPALPETFVSAQLNPVDTPHTYIEDHCEYLRNRWDPNNAAPGTVVMIIMLNNINRGAKPDSSDSITVGQFGRLIENVKAQGFEAINSEQLANFLETNRYIPPRSILFVQDGRRTKVNFDKHFRPSWEERNWPVVNGWIIQENTTEELLQSNLALEQEGLVDHQLYSSLHRFSANASVAYLSDELRKYTGIFEEQFHKAPIAMIWPGKPGENYLKAARGQGFRLGFTANARGPVMYNWIPLADRDDPSRPAYYPEGPLGDPLMTLPRYWPAQVIESLDQVRLTGKTASAIAEQNRDIELEYYDIVCAQSYGPLPGSQ